MTHMYAVSAADWTVFSWLMVLIGLVVLAGVVVIWHKLGGDQ